SSHSSFLTLPRLSRAPGRQRAQAKAASVLMRFNVRFDLKHGIPHRRKAVCPVSLREKFGLNDSGPVGQRQKLHGLARDLMMDPLLDDESADGNGLAGELLETVHRTIGIPGNVVEQFKRMAADGKAKQFCFCMQPLLACW